jgi:LL-diaminopimelate aminotransferase
VGISIKRAGRIEKLPPYLFAQIDRMKKEAIKRGVDLISLGIGDPDLPTPHHIVKRLQEAAEKPLNHRYPDYEGLLQFRQAAAEWYHRRFDVHLDPETEVVSLIGSKEGIANMAVAFVDPGDIVLVPSPGYPVYHVGTLFNGGEPYFLPLRRETNFLPDLESIPEEVARRAKLLWINYPNNPTAAVCEKEFFDRVVEFAHRTNTIVCHDAAYTEIAFDGYRARSFLEADGAREVGIEFHSLSKTYNMTGWRVGFAVGNRNLIEGLGKVKTNVDSGVFQGIQEAAIEALTGDQSSLAEMRKIYQRRRNLLVEGLRRAGYDFVFPRATFYVWVAVPRGYTSAELTAKLLRDAGVVTTPGNGFGDAGEGYIRMTITVAEERLREAVERLSKVGL